MVKIKIESDGFQCERCGHKWIPRLGKEPAVCPSCKSPYWNRPRSKNIKQKDLNTEK